MRALNLLAAYVVLLSLPLLTASYAAQRGSRINPVNSHVNKERVSCLKQVLIDWKNGDSFKSNEMAELRRYFGCFPNDFATFNSLAYFGGRNIRERPYYLTGELLDDSYTYIAVLLPMTRKVVGTDNYEAKLISLGTGAQYDVDAPGLLSAIIKDQIERDPSGMLRRLSRRRPYKIKVFLRFLLSKESAPQFNTRYCIKGNLTHLQACRILGNLIAKDGLRSPTKC